jgi:predicted nucleotidyltransferase
MAAKCLDVERIISLYVAELKKRGIRPQKIILYGSYARGEANQDSDIDLVVISEDLAKWSGLERLEMLSRLTVSVDAPLEVIGYTPDEISQAGKNSIMWAEITRYGKTMLAA